MKITSYNSQKIKVLSFVAIMMVLFIHAVFSEAKDFPASAYIQEFCAFSGLSFVANPLFYSISGYLFFLGVSRVRDCYPKIRKRTRTLLVPYIIWNIIFVLWYVVLGLIPGVSKFVNSDMTSGLINNGPLHALYELFIAPAGFQLWYVRDLLIYVMLSPAIYLLVKHLRAVGLILLFAAGTYGLLYLPSEVKIWGAFFFTLGGYIALHSSLEELHQKITPSFAYVCLLLYSLNAIIRPMDIISLKGTDMVVELCGLVAIWRLYDVVVKNEDSATIQQLAAWGGYSFFIYLFHEPAFNIIKKIGVKVLGIHEWSLILLYLVCPFVMCMVAIGVAKILQRYVPKVYSVLVGGR